MYKNWEIVSKWGCESDRKRKRREIDNEEKDKKRLKSERKLRQKDRRNCDRVTRLKHWAKASWTITLPNRVNNIYIKKPQQFTVNIQFINSMYSLYIILYAPPGVMRLLWSAYFARICFVLFERAGSELCLVVYSTCCTQLHTSKWTIICIQSLAASRPSSLSLQYIINTVGWVNMYQIFVISLYLQPKVPKQGIFLGSLAKNRGRKLNDVRVFLHSAMTQRDTTIWERELIF